MQDSVKTIHRTPKDRDHPYTMVDNRLAEDKRLSGVEVKIMLYLLGKPDDWKLIAEDVAKRIGVDRKTVYKALNRLRKYGYVSRQQGRSAGRFEKGSYHIYEHPTLNPDFADIPHVEQRDPTNRDPDRRTLLSNDSTDEGKNQTKKNKNDFATRNRILSIIQKVNVPSWINSEQLTNWVEHCLAKGIDITPTYLQKTITQLNRHIHQRGIDVNQRLAFARRRGYVTCVWPEDRGEDPNRGFEYFDEGDTVETPDGSEAVITEIRDGRDGEKPWIVVESDCFDVRAFKPQHLRLLEKDRDTFDDHPAEDVL